jgi:glucokinase
MILGIEIGGTKLQWAVSPDGGRTLVAQERHTVDRSRGAAGILRQIESHALRTASEHHVTAIGFGFGGPVDVSRGITLKSHQVSGWDEFPLVNWAESVFGCPVTLGNDCNVAAIAEARFGAGRGKRRVFYVTVGTGVGGGFVIDGRLYGGERPAVAEIGHLRPGPLAIEPSGTIEALASGPGIVQNANRLRRRESDPAASRVELLTTQQVFEAADGHDASCRAAVDEACRAMGWAIAQVITLLAPDVIVIGGGVSLAGEERFLRPVNEQVARFVFPPLADSYRLVAPQLDEWVVVHGAIANVEPERGSSSA